MKSILKYLKDFHLDYFSLKKYLFVSLFIAVLIAVNYAFNIEDAYIDYNIRKPYRIFQFFAIHAIAYYGIYFILRFFNKDNSSRGKFFLYSFIGLIILSIDRSIFPHLFDLIKGNFNNHTYRFYWKILNNGHAWLNVFLLLVFIKIFIDKRNVPGIYGLRFKNVDIKPYFIMLLILAPIIFVASQFSSFTDFYPVYKRSGGERFANFYEINEWYSVLIYEFFYLSDFLNTELLFRGFLIVGVARFIGKDAVLCMVGAYVVLHFGKPVGETISSIFGGYFLGIFAYYTKNIWGGVFIHTGTALLMELFAFIALA